MILTNVWEEFGRDVLLVLIGAGASLFVTFSAWFIKWLTSRLTKLESFVQIMEITEDNLVLKFRFVNKSDEPKYIKQINCYIDQGINKLINCENQEIDCGAIIVKEIPEGCETIFSLYVPPKTCEEHIYRFSAVKKINKNCVYYIWLGNKELYSIKLNRIGWQILKKGVKR